MRRLYLAMLMVVGAGSLASGHMLFAVYPEEVVEGSRIDLFITYGHDVGGDVVPDLAVARLIHPRGIDDLELWDEGRGLGGTVEIGDPGCYILDPQMETTLFDQAWFGLGGGSSLLPKSGRAIIPVGTGGDCGFASGDGLEIVPRVDMSGINRGDRFRAQALWNGAEVGGDFTGAVLKAPGDLLTVKHAHEYEVEGAASDGRIEFDLSKPGLWVVSFEATISESGTWTAEGDDPNGRYRKGDRLDYDRIAPSAYLTFWVGR
jgi:cobalt/nickel transport protein